MHDATVGLIMTKFESVPLQGLSYMKFFKYRLSHGGYALILCAHLDRYPELDQNNRFCLEFLEEV